jgi:rhodanese-related sulfurtransferase
MFQILDAAQLKALLLAGGIAGWTHAGLPLAS